MTKRGADGINHSRLYYDHFDVHSDSEKPSVRFQEQSVADVYHRVDVEVAAGQLISQAIDVDVQAFGIQRLVGAPGVFPKFFALNNSFRRTGEAGKDEKLRPRQPQGLTTTSDVIVLVLDPQVTVVVNVVSHLRLELSFG